jgi:hypothetical protein
MKLLLLGLVCFSFTFITPNGRSLEPSNTRPVATVSAPFFGQCPYGCTGDCIAIGVATSTSVYPNTPCDPGSLDGHHCQGGHYDETVVYNEGPGRDEIDQIFIPCMGATYHETACTGNTISNRLVPNVCCPVGQTDPHFFCNNGPGGDGKCDSTFGCGANTCQSAGQDCGCA